MHGRARLSRHTTYLVSVTLSQNDRNWRAECRASRHCVPFVQLCRGNDALCCHPGTYLTNRLRQNFGYALCIVLTRDELPVLNLSKGEIPCVR